VCVCETEYFLMWDWALQNWHYGTVISALWWAVMQENTKHLRKCITIWLFLKQGMILKRAFAQISFHCVKTLTVSVNLYICCPRSLYQNICCFYTILNYQVLVGIAAPTSHSRHLPLGTACNQQALVLPWKHSIALQNGRSKVCGYVNMIYLLMFLKVKFTL
jgi:hypothetical protein